MTSLDPRFAGNVPALVTPCRADGSADLAAMRRLVEHVVAAGVGAINILGTTNMLAAAQASGARRFVNSSTGGAISGAGTRRRRGRFSRRRWRSGWPATG